MPPPQKRWREPFHIKLVWSTYLALRQGEMATLSFEQQRCVEEWVILSLFAHFEGALRRDFQARSRRTNRTRDRQLVAYFTSHVSARDKGDAEVQSTSMEIMLDSYEYTFGTPQRICDEMRSLLALRNWLAHGLKRPRPENTKSILARQAYGILGRWMECLEGFPADPYDVPE